ncbi:Holliday junction resolvase RuvX [Arsenicicoccus dermatophilus]|uniref:Holliday junction resolvase RuvX n=1 Tax=Arsenicicoccus dermatophilus TaxID=1076331 RepID=UPI0039170742
MSDIAAGQPGPTDPHPGGSTGARLPRGVRLGVDVGTVRVGVARSDPDGLLATPETTVTHVPGRHDDVAAVARLAGELEAAVVYVGLPRTLAGGDSASTRLAREFARSLAGTTRACGPEVRVVDERLTTVDATRRLRESGRRAKAQRQVVDQAAAVLILQVALDQESATDRRAGVLVVGPGEPDDAPAQRPTAADDQVTDGEPTPRRKPRHRKVT